LPKKKKSKFSAVKEVKAMARERIGTPPSEKVVPDKKKLKSTEKNSKTLAELLDDPDR
jgi:hypothetical protein